MKVLDLGSLNIDYVYQVDRFVRPGEPRSALSRRVGCGGKGLNQSVALARAGVETWHGGAIGPDGAFLAEELRRSGVDTRLLRTDPDQSTGHAVIQVDGAGQNCILIYPGTNAALTLEEGERALDLLSPEDVVLFQNETNLVGELMEAAARRGLRIAFNAAPMDGKVAAYPLEKVTWLFVNETEGALLSGEAEPRRAARLLRERYPRTQVVMTLGAEGSLWLSEAGEQFQPACKVEAVDTTGAGDTFTGFFLRGVLLGSPLPPLRLATVASALAVGRPGAAGSIPTLAEVLASPLAK